jgi:hypothetical protein
MIDTKFVIMLVVACLGVIGVFWALDVGLERTQRARCLSYKQHAQELKGFYLTPNQAAMCNSMDIKINAPIK